MWGYLLIVILGAVMFTCAVYLAQSCFGHT